MTKLVVWLLFFGVFTIQTVGHTSSDPAPGRSPGPPAPTPTPTPTPAPAPASSAAAASAAAAATPAAAGRRSPSRDEDMAIQRQPTAQEAVHQAKQENRSRDSSSSNSNNNNMISNNNTISNNSNNEATASNTANFRHPGSELNFRLNKLNSFVASSDHPASEGRRSASAESNITLAGEFVKTDSPPHVSAESESESESEENSSNGATTSLPQQSDRVQEQQPSDNNTICHEDLNRLLAAADVVDQLQESADGARRQQLDIRLQLEHDIFEHSSLGIVCGLMYRVRLLLPPASPPPAFKPPAASSSSSSSTSSASSSTQRINPQSSSSSSSANSLLSGEFFVETLSTSSGRERGSFVSHSLGNKLPISWFSSLQRKEAAAREAASPNSWGSQRKYAPHEVEASASLSASAEEDASDAAEGPTAAAAAAAAAHGPIKSSWNVHRGEDRSESHSLGRNMNARRISSGSGKAKECPDNKWHGDTRSSAATASWVVNELCEQDDVIEFRIFFRAAHGSLNSNKSDSTHHTDAGRRESGAVARHVVFKQSFQFKLLKDCQLQLRETAAGSLDYTSLPLYSTDCSVLFPSYTLSAHASGTAAAPTPGILVELQRLNVPCSSGAFLRFGGGENLCGKLEELSAHERVYHFSALASTSVRIVRSPMFSLTFKLVDYCYNVSSSDRGGEFYVRPTIRDSLECFFRIHLPYGNRILLRLVANNDSELLQTGLGRRNNDDDDDVDTVIYTSQGQLIDAQLINLSLSESASPLQKPGPAAGRLSSAASNRTGATGDSDHQAPAAQDGFNAFAFLGGPNAHARLSAAHNAPATASCAGVVIKVFENDFAKWSHCVPDARATHAFLLQSSSNTLSVHLYRSASSDFRGARYTAAEKTRSPPFSMPAVYLSYEARPVPAIVSNCDFGWIAMQQFCVAALEMELTWSDAERQCVQLGGHLASIRNDLHQQTIDEMLIHSPGYQDRYAYWVGGSDKNFEGDFRWSDGLPFQYTNWFPGWSQHGLYNKQPNDDGLSSQDCIELRRYFRAPPGAQANRNPLARNFMWNDRDCNARNFIICERAMSDDTLRRSWINDCNKTVSLTKEHPRASVWSPSFPRQYPDNANCFTTVTAPSGYRIVIEFEELVIESEPGCTYDYLEITEPPSEVDASKIPKSSKHKTLKSSNINNNSNSDNITRNPSNNLRKRSSYENPSLSSSTSTTSTNSYNDGNLKANLNNNKNHIYPNAYNNYNVAETSYHNLLHVFASLYKPHTNFLIQTPDYPKGNPYYPTNHMRAEEVLPKRLCGDWSSKLKLLRHVSSGSYLGLHFVSDYSHHFGGYKAKTYMENTASECANERLKPYNGSCYLIVSYPEVDWWTAQQICRGVGAKLSSVSSSDEHRFITSNIRNQIDYSPQLIYWLGAELEQGGQFEWTDDTRMSFQGWLPGQGHFDRMPAEATCLGLQWKMSPTPMLPSGLYWQSQKCNKVGGYVCKKPKESFGRFASSNLTVTGTEGRLVSPAYPSAYPLNVDYWIHIQAPERSRIVVQFQKIDLEPQDECLYDFVSIENYDLVSKITLEPGANPLPMAMLMSDEESETDESALRRKDFPQSRKPNSARVGRSIAKAKRKHASGEQSRKSSDTRLPHQIAKRWSSEMQMSSNNSQRSKRAADYNRRERSPQAHGSASKSNENPKRRRRKDFTKEMKRSSPKADCHHKLAERRPSSWSRTEAHDSRHPHQMRGRRKRRSTVVGGGSFGDDALFATTRANNAQSFLPYVRWCGTHDSNMSKFDFVASSNQVVLNFHSDFSVTGLGFAAIWKAIDVSGCPLQTLTSREGTIVSPNFPHFLLNRLSCAYVIQAPVGRRVWLEFLEFDMLSDAALEVDIGNGVFRPFRMRRHVNDGIFVSVREQLRVQFRSGQHPRGRGFQAAFRTVGQLERRERVINLSNNITGHLFHLNYPLDVPDNVDFTQHLVAPFGSNILLELHGVEFGENGCPDNSILEIYDNYADNNGTKWQLCKFGSSGLHTENNDDDASVFAGSSERGHRTYPPSFYDYMNPGPKHSERLTAASRIGAPRQQHFAAPPVYITSYLNTLHIRQRTTSKSQANLNATVRIQLDNNYKLKLASGDKSVESCQPNPCQFKGKCVTSNGTNYCQCQGHYTGRFCGLNLCELEPCIFGRCELTTTSFKCLCQPGYIGATCEQKQRPCADNPCEGRGICYEKNGGYFCRCHAWWEGHRCERRMLHIPYKPLSERMLQEPFWLGLITVFVVLAVIGLVWCAKRHFPEKIEKLLAEEADRNRPPGSIHGHHHHTSLREQLQFTTAIPQTATNTAPGAPRSIFNRLGIRKPSLLSLSSPNPIAGGGGAAARTFSLDDLLRPPPRRSPSPRKKRNNSTPVKKNAAEKKQILQQLVSPAGAVPSPKVSLGELISMTESRLRVSTADSESDLKETTFSENSGSLASSSVTRVIADPKLEKKVTFARLLNKVSAEMSSGSEVDIGRLGGKRNSSALSLPTDIQFRASSMPPSPCTNGTRSAHSTSSNHVSDSLSSSDLALADFGLRSLHANSSGSDVNRQPIIIPGSLQRSRFGAANRPKVSSADSILAMFRNFASTATSACNSSTATVPSNASVFVSPSTTPTVSSPPGDDESSTSSMHTPISFTSGPPDSPVLYRQTTIEVPVLDALNAHKNTSTSSSSSSSPSNLLHPPTILLEIPSSGINNKCLSPIREMPTPIPSPALTPIMPRPQRSNSPTFQEDPLSTADLSDDDDEDDDDDDKSDRSDTQLSDHFLLGFKLEKHRRVERDVETASTDTTTTSTADMSKQLAVGKLPVLRLSAASASALSPPCITIDVEPPTPDEKSLRPVDLVIPTLMVEQPSPTKSRQPMIVFPGSPPPQRASIGETSFMFPNKQQQKRLLKQFEKPTSLDFPFAPPMITVTSNVSELESDAEPLSPAPKVSAASGLVPPNSVGMCYLSPFTMCGRADRTISESNLSSSGYSSMASPGPSRCGSSNPLCPNEMDEPGSGHSSAGLSLHVNLLNRRRSSALASCKENITNGKEAEASGANGSNTDQIRQRSDSETFSDDILLESNDEGISTDHIEEKLDDCRLSGKTFKQLHLFTEEQALIEVEEPPPQTQPPPPPATGTGCSQMAQLQLPQIVIQIDGNDKGLSPVSSRSESPLSERAGMGRFSPHFYGRKDQLPFTDSDGLYDFPSSDGKGVSSRPYTHQRRSSSKKRDRKSSKSVTQSPTKQQLDVPSKSDSLNTPTSSGSAHVCNKHCYSHQHPCSASTATTRKSPKRRPISRHPVATSSSSSESLVSAREMAARPFPRRFNSPNREKTLRKQESLSEDEVAEALLRRISPRIVKEENDQTKPKCKINRLRAIGNQIRFLRRLEKSIKTRERLASPSDSCPEENTDDLDSPQATSPLLQPSSPNKTRIALCRQKRLPGGAYGITAAAINSSWKGMDRSLIGDDLNSD